MKQKKVMKLIELSFILIVIAHMGCMHLGYKPFLVLGSGVSLMHNTYAERVKMTQQQITYLNDITKLWSEKVVGKGLVTQEEMDWVLKKVTCKAWRPRTVNGKELPSIPDYKFKSRRELYGLPQLTNEQLQAKIKDGTYDMESGIYYMHGRTLDPNTFEVVFYSDLSHSCYLYELTNVLIWSTRGYSTDIETSQWRKQFNMIIRDANEKLVKELEDVKD